MALDKAQNLWEFVSLTIHKRTSLNDLKAPSNLDFKKILLKAGKLTSRFIRKARETLEKGPQRYPNFGAWNLQCLIFATWWTLDLTAGYFAIFSISEVPHWINHVPVNRREVY